MKKIISVVLLFTIVLSFASPQVSFASNNIEKKEIINGETFIIKETYVEGIKVVTVENDNSIFKSTYDKDDTIVITKIDKTKKNTNSNLQEEFVLKIELPKNEVDLISPVSNYHNYTSQFNNEYSYTIMRSTTRGRVFDLSIPDDSLETPIVYADDRVYDLSYDFYYNLMDADSYTESAFMAGFGLIPNVGIVTSAVSIIDSLSQENMTMSDWISALIAAVELIPGFGTIISMADFGSHAGLAIAEFYNVRTVFANIKNRI